MRWPASAYDTQIPHQPAYSLFDLLQLIGLQPTAGGYTVTPHLPMSDFDVRFPDVGIAQRRGLLHGYLRPVQGGSVTLAVKPPPGVQAARAIAYASGRKVQHTLAGGLVQFTVQTRSGALSEWAVGG